MSSSLITPTVLALDYPLYACDFDEANTLIVGGGGGYSKTGVSNKISVIDASRPESLEARAELALKNEDSPTSIAVGPHKGKAITVFAGVNSSPEDVAKGKNEHFRVFSYEPPSAKAKAAAAESGGKITELSRQSLFTSAEQDTFQRVLRLSPRYDDSKAQVGAAATGFAKSAQIALFEVASGASNAVTIREKLDLKKEAQDLDIIQVGKDQWQLAYCDDHELYTVNIGKKGVEGPVCIYTIPDDHATGATVRPTFRNLRYLTPSFVLASLNLAKSGGVVLQGFRLPKSGVLDRARIAISGRLPKAVGRTIGMDVRNLSPPSSATAKQGETQFIVAIAGHPDSITLYTLDYTSVADVDLLTKLHIITTLQKVHATPISGLTLSHFTPPKSSSKAEHHLKLASIGSFGRTIALHQLPLKKYVDRDAPTRRGGPPRPVRYISALKSHGPSPAGLLYFLAVVAVLVAVLVQGFLEIKDISQPIIGAKSVTPTSWHTPWRVIHRDSFLAEHIAGLGLPRDAPVVLNAHDEGGIKVDEHDMQRHAGAKEWDSLPLSQRLAWKERLKQAGHWSESMGETVFKSILFGEIAGVVAAAVGG